MTWNIIHGDCLDVMNGMDPDSIDSIPTDPPYGISFMNKGWDKQVPGPEYWAAALRIAKPGAHLAAFGGTKMHHRLMCAIEDAGWEIRDCLMFLHGVGFPKNHGFTCKCSGNPVSNNHGESNPKHKLRSLQRADISTGINHEDKPGEILQHSLQKQSTQSNRAEGGKSKAGNGEQSSMEGRAVHRAGKGLCDDSQTRASTGAPKRVCSGAHNSDGKEIEKTDETGRRNTPHQSRPARQSTIESKDIQESQSTLGQGTFGGRSLCEGCGGVKGLDGYGTALKPAWEPIILARKPFKGSVADNVLKYGTGGLNIDGCRIDGKPWTPHNATGLASKKFFTDGELKKIDKIPHDGGRWPANLLLDEESAVLLDRQSGVSRSGIRKGDNVGSIWDRSSEEYTERGHTDQGGSSRFFYTAKASRSEREGGLDGGLDKPVSIDYIDPLWVNGVLKQKRPEVTGILVKRDTGGYMSPTKSGIVWNTCWCGNLSTDPFHPDIVSIIKTAIGSTTARLISKSSQRQHTNGCMGVAFKEAADGISPVESAANSSPWAAKTGICPNRDGLYMADADLVTLIGWWLVSSKPEKGGGHRVGKRKNTHPT